MALDVICTSAGGDLACKVHEDAGYCLAQQHVIFTGKRLKDCNASSDYSIQPAVIEVLTASLIELGLVLEEKGNRRRARHLQESLADSFVIDRQERASVRFLTSSSAWADMSAAIDHAVKFPFCEPHSDVWALQYVACHRGAGQISAPGGPGPTRVHTAKNPCMR